MIFEGNIENGLKDYTAPLVGNGGISFQVDYEGAMVNEPDFDLVKSNSNLRIWWAARRYLHKTERDLISFGRLSQKRIGDVVSFRQELDTDGAVVRSETAYANGRGLKSEVFVHHDHNLIAVKKEIVGEYRFDYELCDVKDISALPELMTITNQTADENGIVIEYDIKAGMYPYKGIIHIFAEGAAEARICKNRFSLKSDGGGVFYILLCDSVEREDYIDYTRKLKAEIIKKGYSALKAEHSQKWQDYFSEGYISIGNESIDNVYKTAQYHLKCFTTKWSIPMGLNNGSWQGKAFAFDELYIVMGLLTSNHMAAARRIPEFRYNGLDYALFRGSNPSLRISAHYPWETLENGEEGAISGYWHDHVFHMASISCSEYYYYKFTNDINFLREKAYPVIKACATFYLTHMIYTVEGGRMIVGKCTDLERLGASRENAFMTTCGVIKTLQIFVEVSRILGVDEDMSSECSDTEAALKKSLPNDGKRYLPYPDCEDNSIGVLSGTFPYDVIERDSELQMGGIKAYLDSENVVGNMYAVGKGVCSWYMTWKALVFARLGKSEETYKAILGAVTNSGRFGEMFEINDGSTDTYYRPWFTTAAGMTIHAVNEMLLQSDGDTICIAPALPEEVKDFSFRLAAQCGAVVSVKAEGGVITHLSVSFADDRKDKPQIRLPEHLRMGVSY